MALNIKEMQQVQAYLRNLFGTDKINIKAGQGKDSPVEVSVGDEFIGVIYRDFEEGEVSYDFNMSILPEDLPEI
jgi:hypothetical protein